MAIRKKNIPCFCAMVIAMLLSSCYHDTAPNELQIGRTKARLAIVCASIELYREDSGMFPEASTQLEKILNPETNHSSASSIIDGWRRPLRPLIDGTSIVGAYSYGVDGHDDSGSGDDISCQAERGK